MGNMVRDVRYALRILRKSPGFTAAAILTLALGMSVNTLMLSVLNYSNYFETFTGAAALLICGGDAGQLRSGSERHQWSILIVSPAK